MNKLLHQCLNTIISTFTIGLLCLAFFSTSAHAHPTNQNAYKNASHCVAAIDPIQKGQKSSKIHNVNCYKTFQEAIVAATGGSVHLPSNIQSKDVTQSMLRPTSPNVANGSNVIAIMYDDSNWSDWDGEWTITTTGSQCSSSNTYGFTSLSPYGWNDRISSVHDFYNCNDSVLWENDNYGGAEDACYSCTYVGDAMNDQTSSVYWRVS